MKAIKVTADNATAIEAALAEVNGKATAHAYTTVQEIIEIAERGEKKLESLGVIKSARKGAGVWATSGGMVANSYKYSRTVTHVKLERRSADWWLVEVSTASLFPNQGGMFHTRLTEAQDQMAIAALRKEYGIIKTAE